MRTSNVVARLYKESSDFVRAVISMTPSPGCVRYAKVAKHLIESQLGAFTNMVDAALSSSGARLTALEWRGRSSDEAMVREIGKLMEYWGESVTFEAYVDDSPVERLSHAFAHLLAPTTTLLGPFDCESGNLTVLEPGSHGDGVVTVPVKAGPWRAALREILSPAVYWETMPHELVVWSAALGDSTPAGKYRRYIRRATIQPGVPEGYRRGHRHVGADSRRRPPRLDFGGKLWRRVLRQSI
jgi:hypothetical protein